MAEKQTPTASSLLWSVALVALGVWQLYGRSAQGWWAVWAWAMIVFGGIGLLGLLLYPLMRLLPATTPEGAAEGLAELQKNLYAGAHEYRAATPADMRGLDGAFYESVTARLSAAGFRQLGDVVDETGARAAKWARAVIRILLSRDGTTTAGIYHVKLSGFPRVLQVFGLLSRNMRTVGLETELDDGTFVTTSNDRESNTTLEVPRMSRRQFPVVTAPDALLEQHGFHLADTLAAKPGTRPLAFRTLHEVLDSQNRSEEIKSAYRASPAFDHVAEMERVAGRPLNPEERETAVRVGELTNRPGPAGGSGPRP